MDASIKGTVRASDKDAQYDEKAKKLLGHKIILAYILVNTIEAVSYTHLDVYKRQSMLCSNG